MTTNTGVMMSNFLEDLEGVLTQYFGEDWTYDFDYDKPITIHFGELIPIKE
tara:strand:- start:408 stop:560 length:153 start_codon:yes stop_codon:yes gene_type:complete